MNRCTGCGTELSPSNVIRLCLECKRIERDRRAGFTADEVSNLDDAREAFMRIFGGCYSVLSGEPQRTRRPSKPKQPKRKRVTK